MDTLILFLTIALVTVGLSVAFAVVAAVLFGPLPVFLGCR